MAFHETILQELSRCACTRVHRERQRERRERGARRGGRERDRRERESDKARARAMCDTEVEKEMQLQGLRAPVHKFQTHTACPMIAQGSIVPARNPSLRCIYIQTRAHAQPQSRTTMVGSSRRQHWRKFEPAKNQPAKAAGKGSESSTPSAPQRSDSLPSNEVNRRRKRRSCIGCVEVGSRTDSSSLRIAIGLAYCASTRRCLSLYIFCCGVGAWASLGRPSHIMSFLCYCTSVHLSLITPQYTERMRYRTFVTGHASPSLPNSA
jgi:hypothetical protein